MASQHAEFSSRSPGRWVLIEFPLNLTDDELEHLEHLAECALRRARQIVAARKPGDEQPQVQEARRVLLGGK